jgi:hypothetical protein
VSANGTIARRFAVTETPTTFLIDQQASSTSAGAISSSSRSST